MGFRKPQVSHQNSTFAVWRARVHARYQTIYARTWPTPREAAADVTATVREGRINFALLGRVLAERARRRSLGLNQ